MTSERESPSGRLAEALSARPGPHLPDLLGIEVDEVQEGSVGAHMPVRPELLAPNGYLHAASLVALADTACGYGTLAALPAGATGFTTIDLQTNFLRTTRSGVLQVAARRRHAGRMTQVWEAEVTCDGRLLALFRATQMVLYPASATESGERRP